MATNKSKAKGINGARNGELIPFRYGRHGAWAPPYSVNAVPARQFNRETIIGLIGGALFARRDHPMSDISLQLDEWLTNKAKTECPIGAVTLNSLL